MARLPFVKMQGLGNDFVVIDDRDGFPSPLTPDLAEAICDRRFGVGADQILWLKPPHRPAEADVRMEILNADGSVAEMCGNGIRAVALWIDRNPLKSAARKDEYRVETLAGLKIVRVRQGLVRVDMGPPALGGGFAAQAAACVGEELEVLGKRLHFFEVNMGNPHAVFFVEELNSLPHALPIETLGPAIENHPRFPRRTNVEFVQVEAPGCIRVRVWERGAGVTLACGTGACASAVASIATGRAGAGPLEVHLPGGMLTIEWAGPGKSVMMEGPAEEVFRGELNLREVP